MPFESSRPPPATEWNDPLGTAERVRRRRAVRNPKRRRFQSDFASRSGRTASVRGARLPSGNARDDPKNEPIRLRVYVAAQGSCRECAHALMGGKCEVVCFLRRTVRVSAGPCRFCGVFGQGGCRSVGRQMSGGVTAYLRKVNKPVIRLLTAAGNVEPKHFSADEDEIVVSVGMRRFYQQCVALFD